MADPLKQTVSEVDGQMTVTVEPNDVSLNEDRELASLNGYLGVEHPGPKELIKLREINEYLLEEVGTDSKVQYLTALRHIEERLALPRLGSSRVDQLQRYVRSVRAVQAAEEERDHYLK